MLHEVSGDCTLAHLGGLGLWFSDLGEPFIHQCTFTNLLLVVVLGLRSLTQSDSVLPS